MGGSGILQDEGNQGQMQRWVTFTGRVYLRRVWLVIHKIIFFLTGQFSTLRGIVFDAG